MTRAIRIRLLVFVVLAAVGLTYVSARYLGLVDAVLGRGLTVYATLPTSGGLYEGSEVTYRGVGIGSVSKMSTSRDGVKLTLSLDDKTRLPVDAPMSVHNLSAVGEQYLDFTPTSDSGPYVSDGGTLTTTQKSVPVDEGALLVDLNALVQSVDKPSLRTVVKELGRGFADTGQPLQQILDSGGQFVDEASAHTADTIRLITRARQVLSTQADEGDNITSFSRDLADFTATLKNSDGDLRRVLDKTPAAAVQLTKLLRSLSPTLPVLLNDLVLTNQVLVSHLNGLEETLVLFPRIIAGGPSGTDKDGYAYVNFQFTRNSPACTKGYLPVDQWRSPNDVSDKEPYPATCKEKNKIFRGPRYVPGTKNNAAPPSPPRYYAGDYDPRDGRISGQDTPGKGGYTLTAARGAALLGDDSWKYLLIDPVTHP
ncbi:MCE family protein [Nocardioides acrostichi]|uniref:MCE family protein n=1 Tax=Nocardioides acrostichi TaxID=2784339 RepID=A0A930UZZ1_9ACTN|nr:MlaD family protein [Nocardioides acrostichi]MBF4162145.1 MCE family protein [Nocardioides acrostichi]